MFEKDASLALSDARFLAEGMACVVYTGVLKLSETLCCNVLSVNSLDTTLSLYSTRGAVNPVVTNKVTTSFAVL